MSEWRYKAFISYSHRDASAANWLHRALESYRVPRHLVGAEARYGRVPRRLTPIFRDRDELPSASDLGEVVNEALWQSACLIVVCSPSGAQSKWVNEEVLAFKRLGRSDRIYCLIVDGEPGASAGPDSDLECFPPALRYEVDSRGELTDARSEPIAADIRSGTDGKPLAKLKLIAGMLGIGLDELRQREQQRRHRRLMVLAAASIIGMAVTTGLAISAFLARQEAEQQRLFAEAQRNRAETEAETARRTRDFLIELFEVADPSEALGNSITAREILDRGARRIEFELTDQPVVRSSLIDTIGTVYGSLGLYEEARVLLEQAVAARTETFGRDDISVAQSLVHVGRVLRMLAEYEVAETYLEEAIAILRNKSLNAMPELASSLVELAELRSAEGDNTTAEELLREAIGLQRQSPDDASLALARSLDELGITLTVSGKFEEGEALLREGLGMRRRLLPGGVHPDLDDSLNNLAVHLYERGELEETERMFRESLEINEQLLDPTHPDLAVSLNNLAVVIHDRGRPKEAEAYFERALDIRLAAFGENHPMTAQSINNLAFLAYDLGEKDRAIELAARAVSAFRRAYDGDHPETAYSLQNMAAWLMDGGSYVEAGPLLDEALAIIGRVLGEDHLDFAITQSAMAMYLVGTEQPRQALDVAISARQRLEAAYGLDHWRAGWARTLEGAARAALGEFDAAEPLLLDGYRLMEANSRTLQTVASLHYIVDLYESWGRPEEAARYRAML